MADWGFETPPRYDHDNFWPAQDDFADFVDPEGNPPAVDDDDFWGHEA